MQKQGERKRKIGRSDWWMHERTQNRSGVRSQERRHHWRNKRVRRPYGGGVNVRGSTILWYNRIQHYKGNKDSKREREKDYKSPVAREKTEDEKPLKERGKRKIREGWEGKKNEYRKQTHCLTSKNFSFLVYEYSHACMDLCPRGYSFLCLA